MKRYKIIFITSVVLTVLFTGTLLGFKFTKAYSPEKKIEGIEAVAQSFSELTIPKDVRVVGIGEATHGNREFQLVKKDVLEKVVTEGDGHCICFEMAVGDAAMLNDAVHDPDSDLEKVIGKQSYPLYDTPEMVELLNWMRDYNETVPYEDSLMFYGVDIQGAQTSICYLQDLCRRDDALFTQEEKDKLLSIKTETKDDYKNEKEFFSIMWKRLAKGDSLKEKQLSLVAKCVVLHIDAPDYEKDQSEFSKTEILEWQSF